VLSRRFALALCGAPATAATTTTAAVIDTSTVRFPLRTGGNPVR
jgi:hypothetical protein